MGFSELTPFEIGTYNEKKSTGSASRGAFIPTLKITALAIV